jgi:hypothetical protein
MSAFTGQGWRRKEEPGCFAEHDAHVMVQVPGTGYAKPMFSKRVRCERRKGHKGWHSCDNASWSEAETLGAMEPD